MIPDLRKCKFECYGVRCNAIVIGCDFCDAHRPCISCGKPSTHGCAFCGQFVCGAPLCDDCIGTTDKGRSGALGFLNHVHIRKGAPLPSEIAEQERAEDREIEARGAALGVGSELS